RNCVSSQLRTVLRNDERLDRGSGFNSSEGVSSAIECVAAAHHVAPGDAIPESGGKLHGAMEVVVLRAPAAVDLDVLAIDLPVRVDLDRTIIGVVPADDDASTVSYHVE